MAYAPKQTERYIAKNLRLLMDLADHSERDVERLSGVAQKTVNNILHARGEAKIPTVEKIAAVYGLNLWQILLPGLESDIRKAGGTLSQLVKSYLNSNEDGQKIILGIAEREAKYNVK